MSEITQQFAHAATSRNRRKDPAIQSLRGIALVLPLSAVSDFYRFRQISVLVFGVDPNSHQSAGFEFSSRHASTTGRFRCTPPHTTVVDVFNLAYYSNRPDSMCGCDWISSPNRSMSAAVLPQPV